MCGKSSRQWKDLGPFPPLSSPHPNLSIQSTCHSSKPPSLHTDIMPTLQRAPYHTRALKKGKNTTLFLFFFPSLLSRSLTAVRWPPLPPISSSLFLSLPPSPFTLMQFIKVFSPFLQVQAVRFPVSVTSLMHPTARRNPPMKSMRSSRKKPCCSLLSPPWPQ